MLPDVGYCLSSDVFSLETSFTDLILDFMLIIELFFEISGLLEICFFSYLLAGFLVSLTDSSLALMELLNCDIDSVA
jgi:hypothetical protein